MKTSLHRNLEGLFGMFGMKELKSEKWHQTQEVESVWNEGIENGEMAQNTRS